MKPCRFASSRPETTSFALVSASLHLGWTSVPVLSYACHEGRPLNFFGLVIMAEPCTRALHQNCSQPFTWAGGGGGGAFPTFSMVCEASLNMWHPQASQRQGAIGRSEGWRSAWRCVRPGTLWSAAGQPHGRSGRRGYFPRQQPRFSLRGPARHQLGFTMFAGSLVQYLESLSLDVGLFPTMALPHSQAPQAGVVSAAGHTLRFCST